MVSLRKLWHVATKRGPEREARALAVKNNNLPDDFPAMDEPELPASFPAHLAITALTAQQYRDLMQFGPRWERFQQRVATLGERVAKGIQDGTLDPADFTTEEQFADYLLNTEMTNAAESDAIKAVIMDPVTYDIKPDYKKLFTYAKNKAASAPATGAPAPGAPPPPGSPPPGSPPPGSPPPGTPAPGSPPSPPGSGPADPDIAEALDTTISFSIEKDPVKELAESTDKSLEMINDLMLLVHNEREQEHQLGELLKKLQDEHRQLRGKNDAHSKRRAQQLQDKMKEINEEIHYIAHNRKNDKKSTAQLLRDYAKKHGNEMQYDQEVALIDSEKEKLTILKSVIDDLRAWHEGSLGIEQFREVVDKVYRNTDSQDKIAELDTFIRQYPDFKPLNKVKATKTAIEDWKKRGISPTKFIDLMIAYLQANERDTEQEKMFKALGDYRQTNVYDLEQIEKGTANQSTRTAVIDAINRIVDCDRIYADLMRNIEIREKIDRKIDTNLLLSFMINEQEKRMEVLSKTKDTLLRQISETSTAEGDEHLPGGSFLRSWGIQFYSIREIMGALKELKESYLEALHTHEHHKMVNLAAGMGKLVEWAPLGKSMMTHLEKRATSSDEKQKNEFKEVLESQHPNFQTLLFGPNSMMKKEHDPNHQRAILEYAAERGWLYDIDKNAAQNMKKTLGFDLDHILGDSELQWDEHRIRDYWHSLRAKNQEGIKKEIQHSHDRVQEISNVPFFIKEIEHELEELNLWGAVGIAQRAQERGLRGEVGPWVMTSIMRYARSHPEEMKFISNDAFWDKLGALFLYNTGSTAGMFKIQRFDLDALASQGEMADLRKAGTMGRIILRVENHIKIKTGKQFESKTDKEKLDIYVAQMLAGQLVEIDGHCFSIFENAFSDYSDRVKGQGQTNPDKEDEDYYRQISDNILGDAVVINEILTLTGSGQFKYESRAKPYIRHILAMPKDLQKKGLHDAAENFKRITGEKLNEYFTRWLTDSRSQPLALAKIDRNTLFAKALIDEGFVDINIIKTAIQNKWTGEKAAREILRTVDRFDPLLTS